MNIHNKGLRSARLLAIFAVLILAMGASLAAWAQVQGAELKEEHKGANSETYPGENCDPNEERVVWHFILPGNETIFISLTAEFQNGPDQTTGTGDDTVGPPSDKHAWIYTDTDNVLVDARAEVDGPQTEFVLSHVCSNEAAPEQPSGGGGETGGGETGGGETGGSTGGTEKSDEGGTQETGGTVDNQGGTDTSVLGSSQTQGGASVLGGSLTQAAAQQQATPQARAALLAATGPTQETVAWAAMGLIFIVLGLIFNRRGKMAVVAS
jgi:LPXTG-motif cell wall-anchored protein